MEATLTSVKFTPEDLENEFGGLIGRLFPFDIIQNMKKDKSVLVCSHEAVQDFVLVHVANRIDRTGSIDAAEIEDWKEGEKLLDSLDMEGARRRVLNGDTRKPYPYWGSDEWTGEQWEAFYDSDGEYSC